MPAMDATAVEDRAPAPAPPADPARPLYPVDLPSIEGGWRTAAAVGLVLVVAAGVVLRFWTRSALWLDEALTVDIARQPLHQLHALLREDGAPPLYYVLLHFWIRAFGTSNLAVRSLAGVISVATLPVAWLAGRRLGGRPVAWAVLLLLASAPFAVYYATEARMYSLVMFLTACGFLALDRALRRPRPGNLVAVAAVTAGLLYTQYWSLYLVAALAIWLVWHLWRGTAEARRRAGATLAAVAGGCLAFVPWLPTFVFQSRHTGTPWAAPANFGAIISAVTGFTDNQATLSAAGSNQGRLLAVAYFVGAALALFGVARGKWHVDLDLRTRKPGRPLAFLVAVTLTLAIAGGLVAKSAFSPRYASVVFVPLLLLVAYGTRTLADAPLRTIILAVAAVAGLALSVENVWTQRTEAPAVAAAIEAHAQPGDVVAFCPDQLGPATARLLPDGRYQTITYPRGTSPEFVDWIDYKQAAEAVNPAAFAHHLQAQAAGTGQIWMVWAPGYQGLGTRCEQLVTALAQTPGWGAHNWVVLKPGRYYEPMVLTQFAKVPAGSPTGR
jgi:4-amino-4-deoxy-L-arabinose transferase-like glycosyltransferase